MTLAASILVIEDNPTNLEVMAYLLKGFGYGVLVASNAEEALETARAHRPDLVLCDVQLPGMGGVELVSRLRAEAGLERVPIVAVTALAMVGDRERILEAGFNDYVSKPIFPESFIQTVRRHLQRDGHSSRR
jgi:CheY-like chemotaxis protein